MAPITYDYDLIVVGGGSGGMAAAKEAARLGAKVAMFDYVKPSTQGTTWGLGGTCVNVGCVPKKLMHYAGLLGAGFHDAKKFGWEVEEHPNHNWEALVEAVQSHVRSLNWGYKTGLRSAKVEFINALASFVGPHEVEFTLRGQTKRITAAHFIIAVGGRPNIPSDVPGAREYAITSDDIFSLDRSPGKTLCVGASYISLECAGFLKELGLDVTVAIRSIPLRGFDRQCADKIVSLMNEIGVNFHQGFVPKQLEKTPSNKISVSLINPSTGEVKVEEYDTVLCATGRAADTSGLNLSAVGTIETTPEGKIIADEYERTAVPHVYAIGDCVKNRPELTPVAIQAGELLARRLFGGSSELMNYRLIPTAVFTPFEYGCIGYSEEDAEAEFGKDNIETYLFEFTTLEIAAAHRQKDRSRWADEFDDAMSPTSLSKIVCVKSENERVVGFHFIGPNAGEITQGYALALQLGATKANFDKVVGIHPTDAESFHSLSVTRASGESWVAAGGCGGGKCG
eukprot:comp20858_c0_seq1/m.27607 comp20858_c0_seq1/g.27607  ORF comp20858_c0_seq1/g.27607 comp20858_c0_seq1/m.27607 type:complete len:511 (-) comp20858_c0_seq1:243-1775(-)